MSSILGEEQVGLCWVNEGAGHSRLQEQEKQRDRVMRPPAPWRNSVAQCGGRGEEKPERARRAGGQWGLAHCPKAIVPGSVMVNASQ